MTARRRAQSPTVEVLEGAPDPQELVRQCQGLVRSVAWGILQKLPASADVDEMVQDGNLGLAEAARKFDHRRGYQFTTFAFPRVRGAILDGLARHHWFQQSDYHGSPRERPINEFLQLKEQDADQLDQMTLESGMKWFKDVVEGLTVSNVALLAASVGQAEDGLPVPVDVPPSHQVLANETCVLLRQLIEALPEDARTLMSAIYFDGVTVTEAGARIGIGKSWASRLHAKTLKRLALALGKLGFQEVES